MFSEKTIKLITQILLLSVIAIVPFIRTNSLYFPFVSGKVYVFRLLVVLAFFFWVWLLLKEKEYPAPEQARYGASKPNFKNILVIAVVLFFLAQVLVSFFGVDPLLSFFSSIERADGVFQYGFWVLYFLLLISVFRKEQDWKIFFSVFAIIALLLSLYSWLNYKSQPQLYGIFGNPAYFASYLLFAIGFSVIAIERKFFNKNPWNYFFLTGIVFFVFTLIFTQIRGAYAGLAGGIFLFCFLSALFLRKENKKLALLCGIIILLGLVSVVVLFSAKETDFVKSRPLLSRVTEITKVWEVASVRERILNWNIALQAFKEKPVFGYGPENYGSAFNKYYDYRIGKGEPWFDRAHSQPIDTLATGGIVLFSFYLFWLISVIYLIFKITKEKKVLSFLLASVFLAYFLQGLFLFDTLPIYLGLFPFLAFAVFEYSLAHNKGGEPSLKKEKNNFNKKANLYILIPSVVFSLFLIFTTCFIPYKANALALKFYAYTEAGLYKEAKPYLEESFNIKSPYTFWEVRKRAGWQSLNILDYKIENITDQASLQGIKDIYNFITPELEKFAENKKHDQQIYYVLGRMYRFGFEKLGKEDLDKAERILKKGLNYSEFRVEYFNELTQVLLLQGRFEEGEKIIKDYVQKIDFDNRLPYITLGNFYFAAKRYDLSMEEYEKARELGYKFYEFSPEYSRYMLAAEEMGEYQKIVDMALNYLERWGPNVDTYFNIAVGYFNLGEKEKAKEFFLKAVELKKEYEKYQPLFENF